MQSSASKFGMAALDDPPGWTPEEKAQADLTKLKSGKPLKVNHLKPEVSNAQTIALDIEAKAAEQKWPDKGEEKLDAWLKKVGKIKKPVVQASA